MHNEVMIPPERQEAIAAFIGQRTPSMNDADLLVSLRRLLGQSVAVETRMTFPDSGYVVTPTSVRLPAKLDTPALLEAEKVVARSMVPASMQTLAAELARLAVVTAQRASTDADMTLRAAAYIEAMRGYPADIALTVIRKRRHWWPSLFELQEEADKLLAYRKCIQRGIESRMNKGALARLGINIAAE